MRWILLLLGLLLASSLSAGPGVPAPRFTPVPDVLPSPSPETVLVPVPVPSPSPTAAGPPPPPGYGFISQFDRPARLERRPWRVGSAEGSGVVSQALALWNGAGQGPLLTWEPDLGKCDVVISWSSEGLPLGKVSATWWDAGLGWKKVLGVAVDPRGLPSGNVVQLVAHELGHVLGLGHSADNRDMMAERMHTRRYRSLESPGLTARDVQALDWLYRQGDYVPIRGRQD